MKTVLFLIIIISLFYLTNLICTGMGGQSFTKGNCVELLDHEEMIAIANGNNTQKSTHCCLVDYMWRDDYRTNENYKECIAISEEQFKDIKNFKENSVVMYLEHKYEKGYGSYVSFLHIKCSGSYLTTNLVSLIILLLLYILN